MTKLKPCPFCGRSATINKISGGYCGSGTYSACYEISCSDCKIKFVRESKFELIEGKPRIIKDGYQECLDAWNRRQSEQNAGQ